MRELICIVCPRGCHLQVDDNLNVTGNTCKRGELYGKQEVTNPTRIITSTVVIKSELINRLPVKTNGGVPKAKIFDCMKEIDKVTVSAPIHIGDIIIKDLMGFGVDVVATRNILK